MAAVAPFTLVVNAANWVFNPIKRLGAKVLWSCGAQGAVPSLNPTIAIDAEVDPAATVIKRRVTFVLPDLSLTALDLANGVKPNPVLMTWEMKHPANIADSQRQIMRQLGSALLADATWSNKVLFGVEGPV